jgi:hypothetical protein
MLVERASAKVQQNGRDVVAIVERMNKCVLAPRNFLRIK